MTGQGAHGVRAGYALAVLFAINTMNFFDRQILGAVAEPVRREWGLGDGAMGALGTAFTLLYACVGVPLGRWVDRARVQAQHFGVGGKCGQHRRQRTFRLVHAAAIQCLGGSDHPHRERSVEPVQAGRRGERRWHGSAGGTDRLV